jgi:hypothetical protein
LYKQKRDVIGSNTLTYYAEITENHLNDIGASGIYMTKVKDSAGGLFPN